MVNNDNDSRHPSFASLHFRHSGHGRRIFGDRDPESTFFVQPAGFPRPQEWRDLSSSSPANGGIHGKKCKLLLCCFEGCPIKKPLSWGNCFAHIPNFVPACSRSLVVVSLGARTEISEEVNNVLHPHVPILSFPGSDIRSYSTLKRLRASPFYRPRSAASMLDLPVF